MYLHFWPLFIDFLFTLRWILRWVFFLACPQSYLCPQASKSTSVHQPVSLRRSEIQVKIQTWSGFCSLYTLDRFTFFYTDGRDCQVCCVFASRPIFCSLAFDSNRVWVSFMMTSMEYICKIFLNFPFIYIFLFLLWLSCFISLNFTALWSTFVTFDVRFACAISPQSNPLNKSLHEYQHTKQKHVASKLIPS